MKRRQNIAMVTAVLAALLLTAATSHAEVHCPWLNAATAGWLLGGEVQINVTPPDPQGDVTCDFSSGHASTASTLHIAVHTMDTPSRDFASLLAQCGGTRWNARQLLYQRQ
jgi:membrane-associated PAP2 superfamily phosphatase